ncbi:MAG TPA: hypothetical protein VHM88_12680 [Candidatus Acidoferrales bacterium]|nr:hypothetical protein [Candidatus Acidoferrales bacterium]
MQAQARRWMWRCGIVLSILLLGAISGAPAPLPDGKAPESADFTIELAAPEADVLRVVKSVAEDPTVRGTFVFEKEKKITGATPAESSPYFGPWQEPGHAFYKVLTGALAPRHFKDSNDIGTITVRYVVQGVNEGRTSLRIRAVFVEEGRRKVHASDGTVETSEFKEIQDRLREIQLAERRRAEALRKQQEEEAAKAVLLREREEEAAKLLAAESSVRNLEQRIRDLRHDVEVRVRAEGAELKSAPFRSAAKLQSLEAGTEVAVLIVTPYWYGVETPDGRRGWLRHDQVEPLP